MTPWVVDGLKLAIVVYVTLLIVFIVRINRLPPP